MHRLIRAMIAVAVVCSVCVLPPRVAGQQLQTIRIASPPSDDLTPALYAIKAGLFRKYGLDVEIQQMNSGAAIASAVAGASIDIGFSSLIGLIAAHAREIPFQVVAPGGLYLTGVPYALMLIRKDSPIKSARDLGGKTIGTLALRDTFTVANSAWIDQNGGDSTTAHFVELPSSALLPAIIDGRIDAATIVSPNLTVALDSGRVRVLGKPFDGIARRFEIADWFALADYVTKNRDAVLRFAEAMREATLFCNAHHAETVELMATYAKIDPDIVSRSTRAIGAEYLDVRNIQPVIDAAVKYKVIDKAFDAKELISPAALRASH